MKKKFVLKPVEDWETGALEAWLEQEAAKGWRLTAWVSWFAVLKRAEPAQCRVRIKPRAPEDLTRAALAFTQLGTTLSVLAALQSLERNTAAGNAEAADLSAL